MFARKGKAIEQPLPSEPIVPADAQMKSEQLAIGLGLKITGDIETKARLQIDGEVHGEIFASAVLVSEMARVTGGIIADEIVIEGELMGTARGQRVLLRSTCRVQADIFHDSLVIEDDATFEGRLLRSETKGDLPAEGARRGADGPEGVQRSDSTSPRFLNVAKLVS